MRRYKISRSNDENKKSNVLIGNKSRIEDAQFSGNLLNSNQINKKLIKNNTDKINKQIRIATIELVAEAMHLENSISTECKNKITSILNLSNLKSITSKDHISSKEITSSNQDVAIVYQK